MQSEYHVRGASTENLKIDGKVVPAALNQQQF
jgi:hypothetical protein